MADQNKHGKNPQVSQIVERPDGPRGWLKKDFEDAKKEINEWPSEIRPFLDGSYVDSAPDERDALITSLKNLVDWAEEIFLNCEVSNGVCCCGENMDDHVSSDHQPTDSGGYSAYQWILKKEGGSGG